MTKSLKLSPSPQEPIIEGILIVNKPKGKTSFSLVYELRKALGVKKIGHAGTLDPFATGVMVMLIGKKYTRLSDQFLTSEKEYLATVHLGIETDTYDCEGQQLFSSSHEPSLEAVKKVIEKFQGEIEQIPPMFSAKKQNGKKLYQIAREGKSVERKACKVTLSTEFIHYCYPKLTLKITCSKGTYIRSIAHDMGSLLQTGAHLTDLTRTRSGIYTLPQSMSGESLRCKSEQIIANLLTC